MPLLEITASKKVTATITLEDSTAKRIDQYAAMLKQSADDVIEAALEYVFSKDKDFQKHCEEHPTAKPSSALRIKRAASTPEKPGSNGKSNGNHSSSPR